MRSDTHGTRGKDYDDYLWTGLPLGISKFCNCRTLGDPQFYLHTEAGCCRGGAATTGKRSRSSRHNCKKEGCGRCKYSKDNKCDALAVINNQTGCHFCQQSIGPMAIRDDKEHKNEHFPKCGGLNGLQYGWCYMRQLMHVEFLAQKKKWTMWSPARIYSTLHITPTAMEQQDQETSQVGAADAGLIALQRSSDDDDLEPEDEDLEDGAKAPKSK